MKKLILSIFLPLFLFNSGSLFGQTSHLTFGYGGSQQSSYSYQSGDKEELKRRQVPKFLQRSYFEITVGYIDYNFSEKQLQPGYNLEGVKVHHPAVRLVLFGHEIHPNLHAQISYLRPIDWVDYSFNWNDGGELIRRQRTVWMNIAGLTLKPHIQLYKNLWAYGEGGLGVVTRNGIEEEGEVVVEDLAFATVNTGAGLYYKLNRGWGLTAVYSYTLPVKKNDQPATSYFGGGFRYNFAAFKEEKIARATARGYRYPKQWFSFGVSSGVAGYGVNNFFRKYYIFWGGAVETDIGFMASYHRNIFNAPKVFSLDVGANVAYWKTRENGESLFAASLFPVFRFNLARTKKVDPYFFYVLGGPTVLSKYVLDGIETGKHFTFYDAMGIGAFCGSEKQYNIELKIAHYSNGNLFTENRGVKIPLTLSFGYVF